jgi:hypothetical protein
MRKIKIHPLKATAAALALLCAAPFASAQPAPTVRDVAISQDLQKKIEKDYGLQEADYLKGDLQRLVEQSLLEAGQTKVAWVSLTISDAKPNKPTFKQLTKNTSLSFADSLSLGGAKVEAKLYDSSGALLGTVKHSYFSNSLADVTALSTWTDANRAFNGAAYKIKKEAQRDI